MYILILKQRGEGCDYTIGCGVKYVHLESSNKDEAQDEAEEIIKEYHPDSETIIEEALLVELASTPIISNIYDQLRKEEAEKRVEEKKKKDLDELARLKAEYEGDDIVT